MTAALLSVLLHLSSSSKVGAAQEVPDFETAVVPILKAHCFKCHGNGASEGDLALDQFQSPADAQQRPSLWWNVLKNIRAEVMPPPDESKLSAADRETLTRWIKFRAFQIDPERIDPGRNSFRRLNREEYGNTISDLMGIRFDATLLFPPDDSGFGFDNIGDALSFSPLLMEKYLRAAQSIVAEAVPQVTWIAPEQIISGRDFRDDGGKIVGDRMSGKETAHVKKIVRVDTAGKYTISNSVRLHGSFEFDPARYEVIFRVDGQERSRNDFGWDENKLATSEFSEDWAVGDHELAFHLTPIQREAAADDPEPKEGQFISFQVDTVRVEGPEGAVSTAHPPRYERFFSRSSPPADVNEWRSYAQEVLKTFSTRAYRSPVSDATLERLVKIAEAAWDQPDATFESGISQAMVAVLASPRFLFRLEGGDIKTADEPFVDVSEYELASRLSYFLWSTMPDEELFGFAERGELRGQLSAQVARMLNHDRAKVFLNNFVGQWLRTRDVTQTTVDTIAVLGYQEEFDQLRSRFRGRRPGPNEKFTPEEEAARARFRELREISDRFGQELRRAMQKETELCVEHIAKENLSLLDLLDSRYTFLNQDLAELYGIEGVQGREMRRVELPEDSPRGGILGHASMLLVTSNPTRTSPVKRGLFVLENLLGTPSPPAPPGVPDLDESASKFGDHRPSVRELMAAHRESALCASCHARMDPLGLALENFSALGSWRTEEKGQPIDASGQLITGESFRDVRELKRILREERRADFYRCLSQKMLIFATRRGLEFSDEHTVDLIVERLESSGGKFNDLIEAIVYSAPFQKRRVAAKP